MKIRENVGFQFQVPVALQLLVSKEHNALN